jgi:hypothetical protein
MTQATADSAGSALIFVQIWLFSGNPVKYTDPDGKWVPDPDGNLIAEAGDNSETLAQLQGTTNSQALEQLEHQGYATGGTVNLKAGDKIILDNVYTRSIANATGSPTTDQVLSGHGWRVNDYNCWGSAIAGSKGNEIKKGVGIPTPGQFDGILTSEYLAISDSSALFGKSVLKFADKGVTQHGAVFYGRSNDGTVYVYTKNGWHARPEVMKLSDLRKKIPSYGSVTGYYNLR